MAEVMFKCAKCGFEAAKKIGPMGNIDFDFQGKDFYPVCPVITDKLNQDGPLQGALWPLCPHFRDAAVKARPQEAA